MKKYAAHVLKGLFIAAAALLLVYRLKGEDFQNITWNASLPATLAGGLIFLFLTLLNHGLDALSWQIIQRIVMPLRFLTALTQNLKCLGLAFITPANTGELAGRYFLQNSPENKKRALFLTFWMHLPKLTSKLLISIPATALLLKHYHYFNNTSLYISGAIWLAILLGYFNARWVLRKLSNLKIKKWPLGDYIIGHRPTLLEKTKILAWAGLRFAAYNMQLGILLIALSAQEPSPYFWLSIPAFYLVATVIPSVNAIDFVVKGFIAVYFFQYFFQNEAVVVMASTGVWLINMAIPALAGLLIIKPGEIRKQLKWKGSP